jgi:hypothetical protein
MRPITKLIGEYQAILKNPPIPVGTRDPYEPPGRE